MKKVLRHGREIMIHDWESIELWLKRIGTNHAVQWLKAERDELRADVDRLKKQMADLLKSHG